jgi:hypothetical protein
MSPVVGNEDAPMETNHTFSHWIANFISGGAIIATMTGYIPAVAAGVGLIWYLIQIYESSTVQRWLAGRRIRKIARLKARVIMMEAHAHAAPLLPSKPDEPGLPPGYGGPSN